MSDHTTYKRYIFLSIILTSLGVIFSTTLNDSVVSIGTVFIALGAFFLIAGMAKKKKEKEENDH